MQKDFKTAKPTDTGYKTGMLWMLSGVFMGLLVGLSMYFYANRHAPIFATANAAMADQDPATLTREEKAALANAQTPDAVVANQNEQGFTPLPEVLEEPEPRKRAVFSFHAVLPTIDMPVAPRPVALTKATTQEVAQAAPAKSGDLFLQVASFKSMAQANRSQNKLSGRGVTSHVEKHSSKGKTWYRVLAGPIAQMQLPDWKKQVKSLGYDPLVRKVR
ncbi:SPOR domain-containing protein [Leucothrix pacifica]|uniref:SPOR domain-containing protein n=1 Tax=Leucothrix pacifica TaxID=1247513 RepID=A0A317CU47_9GAMM|nr:SPOR domain-containing protein [Leucothrix pacifica]PWQ99852.1 hypothetical protein DKW60_05095 [Leucothrix pacifica]